MSAAYSLGAIVALPFVPYVTDHWGRRWAIMFGSILMIIGAALQTASQNCTYPPTIHSIEHLTDLLHLVGMFVASRAILGLGIPFAIVAASSLIGGTRNSLR
jgi:MFS family permease